MAAPKEVGRTTPEQWGLKEPIKADRNVPVHGDPKRDLFFVRSPVTGDVRGVSKKQADELIFNSNWEPVVEPSAVRLLEKQILRERASQVAAAATGAMKGLSGGLAEFALPHGDEPGARELEAQREQFPGTELAGEVGGLLAPFAGPLKGARLFTVPGVAEAAGQALTKALPGKIAARAAGVGLEGGIVGATYEAGHTAIDDSPLTAQKLVSGFLAGAVPGAVIGGGIGAVESLGSRFAARGGLARDDVLKPGLTDRDMYMIAQREHGVADPGLIEDVQAAMIRDPNVNPEFLAMARDRGPAGQQVRRELQEAPLRRQAALDRAAKGLDVIHEIDDLAIEGWTAGEQKRRLVEQWMEGITDQPDINSMLAAASGGADAQQLGVARLRRPLTHAPQAEASASASRALGEAEDQLDQLRQLRQENPARRDELNQRINEQQAKVNDLQDSLDEVDNERLAIAEGSDRPAAVDQLIDALHAAAKKDKAFEDLLLIKSGGRPGKGPLYGWEPMIRKGLINQDETIFKIVSEAFDQASPRAMKALNGKPGARVWRDEPLSVLDDLGKEADALLGQPRGVLGEARQRAASVRDLLANARQRILQGDRVEAHIALDTLKKQLSPFALPDQWLGVNDNVARFVREGYEDLRKVLERGDLWGPKAAQAQREMNALFHSRMARKGAFFDNFFDDAGVPHPRNPWVNQRRASPDKVRKALNGIIDQNSSQEYSSFKGHIAETRDLVSRMRDHYDLSPEQLARLDDGLKGIDDAESGFDEAVTFSRREAQANALAGAKGPIPGYAKWFAMGLLGPVGFAGALAAERILSPGQAIFQRAIVERVLRGSEGRVAKAVTKLLTGENVKFSGLGVTELAARASTSMLHDKPDKRAGTYAETLAEITKLSTPEAAKQAAQESMPFAVGMLPMAPEYMGGMLMRAARYVASNIPVKPRWTPMGIVVDTPSDGELERFERIYAGAFDPISAIEDAADGNGSTEGMAAAEHVAPELVEEVRALMLEELGNGGYRRSYEQRVDVSIVLGIPLDQTMTPDYINAQQMVHAARFKTPPDDRRTFNADGVNEDFRSSNASPSDKLESGEPPR